MKKGDIINGYTLLHDFTSAGAGQCMWSFAYKSGEEVFIKQFLTPTYPVEGSPGSEKTKTNKKAACERFEKRQIALKEAVARKCGSGGNLIFTRDFFRFGTKYYKVTEKIDTTPMRIEEIAGLSLADRILLMKTLARSLYILHELGIVHCDLKPENALLKLTATKNTVAKLIDFDSSFFEETPPKPDDIGGTMTYFSPELVRYMKNDGSAQAEDITLKTDIFALGLIFSQYLTGELPQFDRSKHTYACTAINCGEKLTLMNASLPESLVELVNRMLLASPIARPSISQVFADLKAIPVDQPTEMEKYDSASGNRLKGSLMKDPLTKPSIPPAVISERDSLSTDEKVTTLSRLRGKLVPQVPD